MIGNNNNNNNDNDHYNNNYGVSGTGSGRILPCTANWPLTTVVQERLQIRANHHHYPHYHPDDDVFSCWSTCQLAKCPEPWGGVGGGCRLKMILCLSFDQFDQCERSIDRSTDRFERDIFHDRR